MQERRSRSTHDVALVVAAALPARLELAPIDELAAILVRKRRDQPVEPDLVGRLRILCEKDDDVAAHVLYVARLCKERLASRPVPQAASALVRGLAETPACALDKARFRPQLESLYTRMRLRRALIAAYERAGGAGLSALCDRFRAGTVGPAQMVATLDAMKP